MYRGDVCNMQLCTCYIPYKTLQRDIGGVCCRESCVAKLTSHHDCVMQHYTMLWNRAFALMLCNVTRDAA